MYELVPLAGGYVKDFVVQKPADKETAISLQLMHSERLREALTNLGPTFVKAGMYCIVLRFCLASHLYRGIVVL